MGQASDRINDSMEFTEARVIKLRQQIAFKRQELGQELAELKRRREETIHRGKRLLKAAGIGAVGVIVFASLATALSNLLANDRSKGTANRSATDSHNSSPGILPGIIGFGLIAVRWAAKEYVNYKLAEHREERWRSQSHRDPEST